MLSNIDHKAIAALLHGQGCANRLKTLIEKGSVPTEPLVDTILASFSLALSFMNSSVPSPHHESVFSKHGCSLEMVLEHYRGHCPDPLVNEGFSWRKYGQKKIKTSTHLRSYYRCAFAKDGNCSATKRVQQIQDNPSVYRTIYVGLHTCEAPVFSHSTNDDTTNGSKIIRFEKHEQDMSGLILPQLVSVDHQANIEYEQGTYPIMNQECDTNELFVDDEQFWADQFPPFSPGNFMSLDDIPSFDYNFSQD